MKFLSRAAGMHYGSFNYTLGLIEHSLHRENLDGLQRLMAGDFANGDPSEIEQLAYTALSPLHEIRHFQDQYGTLAGIGLMSARMGTLRRFAAAVRGLSVRQESWQMPIAKWVSSGTCPDDVRAFYRMALADRTGADALIGNFAPLQIDGHLDELFVEVKVDSGIPVDAATVRTTIEGSDTGHRTLLYPLGLEVVFEASAHALTRSLVGGSVPDAVELALQQRLRVPLTHEDAMIDAATPYMILDLLISRHMRARGRPQFYRNLVLGVADEILSRASMRISEPDGNFTVAMVDRLGEILIDILEKRDVDELAAGTVGVGDGIDESYAGMLAQLEKGGDWDRVIDDGSLEADVAIWESFVAQHYVVPLLRLRLETGHRAFRSAEGFLETFTKVEHMVSVMDGRIQLSPTMPPRVRDAWWRVALIDEFVTALVDKRPIACPRAFASLPGLGHVSFTTEGSCASNMVLGCGIFDGGRQTVTPACWFQSGLRATRFLPPQQPA